MIVPANLNPDVLKKIVKPALTARLGLVMQPEPRGQWEGRLKGKRGAARKHTVFALAQLRFVGGVMEGAGVTPEFPSSAPGSSFALDGRLSGSSADFAILFEAEGIRSSPFICTGALDAESRNLRGKWEFTCFSPDTCGCKGGGGDFHFWRVS